MAEDTAQNSARKWCEHGFEKGNCYQCDSKLAEKFKKSGDWCGGHDVPESQCFPCNSGLQEEVNKRLTISAVKPELLKSDSDTTISFDATLPKSAFCGTHHLRIKFSRKEIASLIGIKIAPVRKRAVKEILTCNGEVMYNATNQTKVASRYRGIIQKVNVHIGQRVKKGQILAVIDSPDLGQLRTNIATQKKLFDNKKKIYSNIKKMLALLTKSNISSSQATEKMKTLEIGLAKSSLLEKLAELELAQSELNRQKEMEKEGVGLKKNLLQTQKRFDSIYTSYVSLLEHTKVSAEIEIIELQGELNNALQNLGTKIKRVSKKPSEYLIRAPFDATIISVKTVKGELVEYGKPLFLIADLSSMWVRLDVFEKDLPRLKNGQPVRFKTDSIKDVNFEGKILWLGSEVHDKVRTVSVLAQVNNKENLLRVNMFGKVKILIHQNENVVVVPKKAIQWEGCCHIVFIQLENDLYAPRKVRLGYEGKDFYEVKAGLLAGEPVVTEGSFLLKTEILKSSIGAGCTD
ncbi:efflux RND transporter periplasmic adaptor subunit [Candidatus Uabimicrobium amorphum]|uniref:efflux RND transporter periplasmic adaptor subunit n=1 Tax=Uabimicrobium amorphum TaxID=2596890 RepID=UPI0034A11E5B